MVHKKIQTILSMLTAIMLSLTLVNAATSFTITPVTVSDSVIIGDPGEIVYTIENTGSEELNLTITKSNLVKSGESISLSLNETTITDLAVAGTIQFKATYPTAGKEAGNYTGTVTVTNTDNTSETAISTINSELSVKTGTLMEITDFDDDTIIMSGEIDEKETETFRIKNTGTVDLTNIQFYFYDLDGEDEGDDIDKKELSVDDDGFDLDVGESEKVELEIDVPDEIEVDKYVGKIIARSDEGYELEIEVRLDIDGGDIEVEFDRSTLSVRDGIMKIEGEPGDLIDNYEFTIENVGKINVDNLVFEMKADLEEQYSSEILSASAISFSKNSLDLDAGDDSDIEVKIDVPEDLKTGLYTGELRVKSSTGKVYDDIVIEVKVVGDVYISEIEFESEVEQNDALDVKITIKNQGSQTETNVKVSGTIQGIDLGNSDLIESSSSFLLSAGKEKTETLRFDIPESARDGGHTLEITLTYDDGTVVELKDITVNRPSNKLVIESSGTSQNLIKCDDSLYVFNKVKNIGKYDQTATFTVEVIGTSIKKEIKDIQIDVDESVQQNFNLELSDLESGSYEVVSKVSYSGFFVKDTSLVTVRGCNSASTGLDIKPIEDNTNSSNTSQTDSEGKQYELFGQTIDKTQIYLIVVISIILILIVVSLFFI